MSPFCRGSSRLIWSWGEGAPPAKRSFRRRSPPSKVPSQPGDDDLAAGRGPEASRLQQHVDEAGAPAQGLAPGVVHLSHHRDGLALVLLDLHLHLRVHEEVAGEEGRELALDLGHGEAGHRHLAQQGQGDDPAGLNGGGAGQVVVAEDVQLEHVPGAHARTRGRGGGGLLGRSAGAAARGLAGGAWGVAVGGVLSQGRGQRSAASMQASRHRAHRLTEVPKRPRPICTMNPSVVRSKPGRLERRRSRR